MNERTIFLQALEKAGAAERAAYLAEACGPDATLRHRVEQLLQSHTRAGSFLAAPALGQQVASEATPQSATETHAPGAADGTDDIVRDFLAPATQPESLGRLGHYEVLEVVGRGGMGIVLRAFDEKLHRVVALKVMVREIAGSAAARKRFSREAKAAAAVVHDHIVPIHAIEEAGPTPYLVMQFVEGQSLQQMIDNEGSLELKEVLRIGIQIASGLAAAHKQGLVHRDIKPSNILLENGVQRVKITDFGLARAVDDASVSQSGVVAGTPQYMSPEQADGRSLDHRSDLFSLGSVLYAMCTGRPPFRAVGTVATLKRVCEDAPRPIRELNPDIPDWLGDIIGKLHAKEPDDRFQSANEVAELLEQHLAYVQHPGRVAIPAPVQPAPRAVATGAADSSTTAAWLLPLLLGTLAIGGIVQLVLLVSWITRGRLFGWAALASAAAMGMLVLFFLYHLGKYWRERRANSAAGRDSIGPAMAARVPPGAFPFAPAPARRMKPSAPRLLINIGILALAAGIVLIAVLAEYAPDSHAALYLGLGVAMGLALVSVAALWFYAPRRPRPAARRVPGLQIGLTVLMAMFLVGAAAVTLLWLNADQVIRTGRLEIATDDPDLIVTVDGQILKLNPITGGTSRNTWGSASVGTVVPTGLRRVQALRDGRVVHDEVVWVAAGTNTRVIIRKPDTASAAGWVPLFNGRDRSGWKTHPEQPGHWRVEGGNLMGSGPGAVSHLFSERDDYEDFHLRAEARINFRGEKGVYFGNSGIYFRASRTLEKMGVYPTGYEAQIFAGDSTPLVPGKEQNRTGSLYGLKRYERIVPGADAGEWFTLEVIARGPRITIKVNGVTTVEEFEDSSFRRGHFALQQAGAETVIQFRKIEVKELSAAQSESSGVSPNAGVLTLRFEPGDYSEKVRRFGVVVQVRNARRGRPSQQVVRVGEKVATTYGPGEYTLEINEPGEVELSRTRVKLGPKGEEEITVRPRAAGSIRRALDGRWVHVSAEYHGRPVPPEEAKDMFPSEMIIKGERYGLTSAGKQHEGGLRIDPNKSPAEMDFTGAVFAGQKPGKTIYELDGDRLRLCLPYVGPNADPPRPTSFQTDPQSKNVVLTYRRAE